MLAAAFLPGALPAHTWARQTSNFTTRQALQNTINSLDALHRDIDEITVGPNGTWIIVGTSVYKSSRIPQALVDRVFQVRQFRPHDRRDRDRTEQQLGRRLVLPQRRRADARDRQTVLAQRPSTAELWGANTHTRNLVRFEPKLCGHVIDSRITTIDTGATARVTPIDLNPASAKSPALRAEGRFASFRQASHPARVAGAAVGTAVASP